MLRTMMLTAALLFAAGVLIADETKTPDVKGTWVPTEGTIAGERMPDNFLTTTKLILNEGKYNVVVGEGKEDGTYKMDFTKKPFTCDIIAETGPNKGKTIPAIIEITGDTMKVAYNLMGTERPKDFTSTKENKITLMVYKREKPSPDKK